MNQNIVWESCSNIRALARVALRGKWKTAVVATAIYMVALTLPAAILDVLFFGKFGATSLSSIYTLLVTAPFTIGYSIFCLNLFRGMLAEPAQIFYGFERFFRALGLYLLMCLFIFLWCLLLVVPGIIAAFRYSQAFLIMADHPEYSPMECLAESKQIMRGNKWKLFVLEMSFIGWAFLASIPVFLISMLFATQAPAWMGLFSLIGSIGYFWLTPYLYVATVAFYEMASGRLKPGVIEVDGVNPAETGEWGNSIPRQTEEFEQNTEVKKPEEGGQQGE